jgi:serine/threonine-protein phosphatase 2A regulatory subunit B''
VCGLPKFFKNMLFDRIDSGKTGKITKPHFLQFWRRDFHNADIHRRLFKILAKSESPDYLQQDDFKPMMKTLLETHPGLEFL